MADSPRPRARTAAPAARLGHFQLLEPLGHGGMGTVYSAYDLDLDRKVAIKVLTDASGSNERALERNQRLLREAQAMAKLSHPNVVPVYEVGTTGDSVFIAMEYVAGEDLAAWCKQKRPWRAVVDVFVQAARGLDAAHAAGIVHRDFKPANVLIDTHGHVRVTDFGIALVTPGPPDRPTPTSAEMAAVSGDHTPHASAPLTDAGVLVGTPAYMSPEQHRGVAVDARSDQFSFCVALWEALYGKRPFEGKRKELADNVIHGRIDKPDPKSAVPAWVSAVLHRGLATDPAERFASMTDVVTALSRDPQRRRRQFVAVIGGGALIAAIAAFAGWGLNRRVPSTCTGGDERFAGAWDAATHSALDRAFAASKLPYAPETANHVAAMFDAYRERWISGRVEACRATRERREQSEHVLDLEMACFDGRLGELRALTALLAGAVEPATIERAIDAASQLAPLDPCNDAGALLEPSADPRRAALRERLDRVTAAERLYRDKDALAELPALLAAARTLGDHALLAETLQVDGILLTRKTDYPQAEATLEEALRHARLAGNSDRFVRVAISLADTLSEMGIVKARESLGVVRVAQTGVDDSRDPTLPILVLLRQGNTLLLLGRAGEALPILRQASERATRALGPDHVLDIRTQLAFAGALLRSGGWPAANAAYDRAVANSSRALGALYPITIATKLDRCLGLASANIDAGKTCFDTVLPDADRVYGRADRRTLTARNLIGQYLFDAGKLEAARTVIALALADVTQREWDENWLPAIDLARALGQLEVIAGDYAAGLEHCSRASAGLGDKHKALDVETCIGEAELGLGHAAKALARIEALESLTLDSSIDGVGLWRFAYARAVWAARHDAVRAKALALQARTELAKAAAWKRTAVDEWLAHPPQ